MAWTSQGAVAREAKEQRALAAAALARLADDPLCGRILTVACANFLLPLCSVLKKKCKIIIRVFH